MWADVIFVLKEAFDELAPTYFIMSSDFTDLPSVDILKHKSRAAVMLISGPLLLSSAVQSERRAEDSRTVLVSVISIA